ncbi:MAG: response regulator, partial [Holophagales bacterium]|nr:response regulator [Holophagales bacterium]
MTPGGRVAVVEDDEALLDQLTWALRGHFEILGARNADEGRALLDQDPEVFLIDLRLPPSNEAEEGLALLRSIRQARPDATVVVMSGETDRRWALK